VQIYVREGQPVGRGAPLFKIDDAELRAQVARATAERDLARQTYARTRDLLAQNASATADLERAEATARVAQAQLGQLAVRLARTTVRAPFAGVAGQRFVSVGDYVTPQTRLVSLQTSNPQRVALTVPERYAADLRRGQRVAFDVAAFPGQDFGATVEFVDPVVQLPGRTITVKALAPNPRGRLQPGMFVEARLATAVRPSAVTIPEAAVMPAPGGKNAVWLVQNGKAVRRDVTLGVRSAGAVEATSGVRSGDQVVVGGVMQLADGAPVRATVVTRDPGSRAPAERAGGT
jgi:membrane fusion protein (multidrug efflux system)